MELVLLGEDILVYLSTMNVSENRNLKSSYIPSGQYLRIYTGTEDTEDLINDLNNGFKKLKLS